MIEIVEIKKIGKGQRYHVQSSEGYAGVFQAEILAKHKLHTGQMLENDEFEKIKVENGDLASFDRALSLLEHGMKTEKMIRDYLSKKGYPDECIDRAVTKLCEYGYIDDKVFAQNFVTSYSSSKGRKKLKYELLSKGVSQEIIDEVLANLSDEEEIENGEKIARKYVKNKQKDQKNKQKLFSHLASKGFDYEKCLSIFRRIEDDWN